MIGIAIDIWQGIVPGGVSGGTGGGAGFTHSLDFSDRRNSFYFVLI